MLQLRLMEKKRELVRQADVDELIDGIAGANPDCIVERACAVRAAWRFGDPALNRAGRVRGAHRDCQRLPADGRKDR